MTADSESFRNGGDRVRPGWATALASAVGLAFGPSVVKRYLGLRRYGRQRLDEAA